MCLFVDLHLIFSALEPTSVTTDVHLLLFVVVVESRTRA